MNPATFALALALLYFVWPIDLVPDIFGPLGRVDDLMIFALVAWQAYRMRKRSSTKMNSGSGETEAVTQPKNPYEVLGLAPGATQDEVDARYRLLAHQYHPDKVNHLGEELQKLAHQKMLEITEAYKALAA